MVTKGVFIYKSIQAKDGGSFTNAQGQAIQYKPSYEVKFDEIDENNVSNERKMKIAEEDTQLINKVKALKPYTHAVFSFEAGFNSRGVYLKLIDVAEAKQSSSQDK